MPQERLPMRKIREVLRLSADGLSKRKIAASLGLSPTAAGDCIRRARRAGVAWPLAPELTDATLEQLLYRSDTPVEKRRPMPDWATVHRELKRPGVTLLLLWEEHRAACPDGYSYSRWCEIYNDWKGRLTPTMRQTHVAGERLMVDYAGTTLSVIDGATGEVLTAQLFVAVLASSNYTYADATFTQTLPDWIGSHTRALYFFGGSTSIIVSDYVSGNIILLLCRTSLCGRCWRQLAFRGRTAGVWPHNELQ
jgi:transposase